MAIDISKYGIPVKSKAEAQGTDLSKYGTAVAAREPEKKKGLFSFIKKDITQQATEEDKPTGVKGVIADIYQSTLGSEGISGLAQAPVRPILQAASARSQESMYGSRKDLADQALALIEKAKTLPEGEQRQKLLQAAREGLSSGEAIKADAQAMNEQTPQSTSTAGDIERILGQSVNTALTLAPFAKGAQAVAGAEKATQIMAKPTVTQRAIAGAKTGAGYGAGYGAGGALAEEKSAGDVLKSTLLGGATGAAIGAATPVIASGLKKATSVFGKRSAEKAAQAAEQTTLLEGTAPDARVATKTLEAGKVVTDKTAKELVRQGVPEADVAMLNKFSAKDSEKALKMLRTRVAQKTNARMTERASDVPGKTFIESIVKPLQQQNKKAAQDLDMVARRLVGKKVDALPSLERFSKDLDSAGIRLKSDGKTLNFKGSDFEGIKGAQTAIKNVWQRAVRVVRNGDAMEAHRVKRYIDEIVDYGKNVEGLSGRAQNLLKGFRKSIDTALDTKFPAYNKANTVYAETITELNKIGEAMGRKFKAGDSFADAKAGVVLRRLFSNTQSRGQLLQVLESSQNVAKKYGAKIDEDVVAQAKLADTLERIFGSEAPTSMQGIGEKVFEHGQRIVGAGADALRGNWMGAVAKGAKHTYDVTRGLNEENLIKALQDILARNAKKASNFGKK